MKWTYTIKNKLLASLSLAVVLGLVMLNNLHERSNSLKLKNAFISMYDDRLIAETYILRISENLHHIRHEIDNPSEGKIRQDSIASLVSGIRESTALYKNTKLTQQEDQEFFRLERTLALIEKKISSHQYKECQPFIVDALKNLSVLSGIQIAEGSKIKDHSDKIFYNGMSSSQFEMTVLIIIALLIQALIFTSESLKVNSGKRGFNWN